jgi:hypothetical protein
MHIHGGQLNSNLQAGRSNASESALAARRAEFLRKRFGGAARGIDSTEDHKDQAVAGPGAEDPWVASMVGAWSGGQGSGGSGGNAGHAAGASQNGITESADELQPVTRTADVSFWA